MKDGVYNAKIEDVSLEFEDHGYLFLILYLVHEAGHQAFGIINLMSRFEPAFTNTGGNIAGWFIKRVFDVCEVRKYSELKGKALRIREENGLIKSIGNLIKDDWFTPEEDFKVCSDESQATTD